MLEASYGLAGFDQAKIAEAPNIQHRTVAGAFAKQRFMKCGHQRRALAASGNIAAAEVADYGDARQLRKQCRVADLHGKPAGGFMTDGLAMAADRTYVSRLEVLLVEQRVDAVGGEGDPVLLGNR